MNKILKSLCFTEMQIKATVRHHHTRIRMARTKKKSVVARFRDGGRVAYKGAAQQKNPLGVTVS